jgi:hypothetical protein
LRSIDADATGYCAQEPDYKADLAARVRRFIRFLEDQGYIVVDDGIDDLERHFADYSDNIDDLQLAQGRVAKPTDRRPSTSPRGFAYPDDAGMMSMTRLSASTRCMIVAVRSGASEAS